MLIYRRKLSIPCDFIVPCYCDASSPWYIVVMHNHRDESSLCCINVRHQERYMWLFICDVLLVGDIYDVVRYHVMNVDEWMMSVDTWMLMNEWWVLMMNVDGWMMNEWCRLMNVWLKNMNVVKWIKCRDEWCMSMNVWCMLNDVWCIYGVWCSDVCWIG